MSNHSLLDVAGNIVKDAPPVAVGGLLVFGVPVNTVVIVVTGVYTVVRMVRELGELYDWYKRRKRDRDSTIHPR